MTVTHTLAVLSSSDLVVNVEIIEMNVEPKVQSLRTKATLKRDYVLYVNEGIGENYLRYSYHLQKEDKMIRRWDNAPHWKNIRTFPFHLHLPNNDKPVECGEVFVKVLVTGGAGCVGSNLCRKLAELNAKKVIILDNMSSAFERNIPKADNVTFVKGDILDDEMLKRVYKDKPDYVFHLAAHFAKRKLSG